MKYTELDTPSLLVDQDIMMANIEKMQKYADEQGVAPSSYKDTQSSVSGKTAAGCRLQRHYCCKDR